MHTELSFRLITIQLQTQLQQNYSLEAGKGSEWSSTVDPPFQFETVLQQAKPSILTRTGNAATFAFP